MMPFDRRTTGKRGIRYPHIQILIFKHYRLNRNRAQQLFFAALRQRCTALHKSCLSTIWLRVAIFFASLRQRSCSPQCSYYSLNAVTKMHCCSERKTTFIQPFCSARFSANKSLKQRCFNAFCIVRVHTQVNFSAFHSTY